MRQQLDLMHGQRVASALLRLDKTPALRHSHQRKRSKSLPMWLVTWQLENSVASWFTFRSSTENKENGSEIKQTARLRLAKRRTKSLMTLSGEVVQQKKLQLPTTVSASERSWAFQTPATTRA